MPEPAGSAFTLGAKPNAQWANATDDAPPSYAASRLTYAPLTGASFAGPSGNVLVPSGGSAEVAFHVANHAAGEATVKWRAQLPAGLHLDAGDGNVRVASGATQDVTARISAGSTVGDGFYDVRVDGTADNGAILEHLDLHVRVTREGKPALMGYALNRFGNGVMPVDLTTGFAWRPRSASAKIRTLPY